jgi:hypothetical protein
VAPRRADRPLRRQQLGRRQTRRPPLVEHLVAHAPVHYVDPPVLHPTRSNNPAVAASTKQPRLRMLGPRLARFSPVVQPKARHPAVMRLANWTTRRQLSRAVGSLGGDVEAVITT